MPMTGIRDTSTQHLQPICCPRETAKKLSTSQHPNVASFLAAHSCNCCRCCISQLCMAPSLHWCLSSLVHKVDMPWQLTSSRTSMGQLCVCRRPILLSSVKRPGVPTTIRGLFSFRASACTDSRRGLYMLSVSDGISAVN